MKPFIFGKWHAWESNGKILLSDEDNKTLRSFANTDDCINWLFMDVDGNKDAARTLNKHVKQVPQ